MNRSRFGVLIVCAMVSLLTLTPPRAAVAQSLTVGDTDAGIVDIKTEGATRASTEWNAVGSKAPAVALRRKLQDYFGATMIASPSGGITTTVTVRYTRNGVHTDLPVMITLIPVVGRPTRNQGGEAVFMVARYKNTPQLPLVRVLLRQQKGNWHVTEYARRKDRNVWEMSATFGDCLVRSSLKILEQRNGVAHASLRQRLNDTARSSLITELKSVYDVRTFPVGQRELCLTTALMVASNVSEEYSAGFVSGALDQQFKPERSDNEFVKQAKALAKDILDNLRKGVAKYLWDVIRDWLGI